MATYCRPGACRSWPRPGRRRAGALPTAARRFGVEGAQVVVLRGGDEGEAERVTTAPPRLGVPMVIFSRVGMPSGPVSKPVPRGATTAAGRCAGRWPTESPRAGRCRAPAAATSSWAAPRHRACRPAARCAGRRARRRRPAPGPPLRARRQRDAVRQAAVVGDEQLCLGVDRQPAPVHAAHDAGKQQDAAGVLAGRRVHALVLHLAEGDAAQRGVDGRQAEAVGLGQHPARGRACRRSWACRPIAAASARSARPAARRRAPGAPAPA